MDEKAPRSLRTLCTGKNLLRVMRFRSFDFQNLLLPLDYNRFIEKLVIGWISIDEQLAQPQQVLPASEL